MIHPVWLVRAAERRGLTVQAYLAKVAAKQRWCIGCHDWHHESTFGPDRSRPDGLNRRCYEAAREHNARADAKRRAGKLTPAKALREVLAMLGDQRPHDEIAAFIESRVA